MPPAALRRVLALMESEHVTAWTFFAQLDRDHDGELGAPELRAAFAEHGLELSEREVKEVMESLDHDGDGELDLAEFMEGLQQARQQQPVPRLTAVSHRMPRATSQRRLLEPVPALDLSRVQPHAGAAAPRPVGALEEILAAMQEQQNFSSFALFRTLDADGSGTVDVAELRAGMVEHGVTKTAYDVKEMLAELDQDGDGEVEVVEFMQAMQEARTAWTERQRSAPPAHRPAAPTVHFKVQSLHDEVQKAAAPREPEPEQHIGTRARATTIGGVLHNIEATAVSELSDIRAFVQGLMLWKISGTYRLPAFIGLICSLVLPTVDVATDWAVTVSFYLDGEMDLFKTGLIIQLMCGFIGGLLLSGMDLTEKLGMSAGRAYPLGILLGLIGLAQLAHAGIGLSGNMSSAHTLERLKLYKAIELVFEALPQSLLQAWVGVTRGCLGPSSESFSVLLTASLCISVVTAGVTCFTLESIGRNGHTMTADVLRVVSRYGVAVIVLRAAQHATLVLSIALLGCAIHAWAGVAVVLAVALVFTSGYEAVDREGSYSQANVMFLAYVTLVCSIAIAFATVDHLNMPILKNAFLDTAEINGGPGDPQYYACSSSVAITLAYLSFFVSCGAYVVSVVVDPVLGMKRWRTPSWEHKLAVEVAKMYTEGLTDDDVLEAKISAVYEWADAIKDNGLGPAEILRMADELPVRWGSKVLRGGRSGVAVNFIDGEEKVQIEWDGVDPSPSYEDLDAAEVAVWCSVWELERYEPLCAILGVDPLANDHTHHAKGVLVPRDEFAAVSPILGSPRFTTAAGHHKDIPKETGTIGHEAFAEVCRRSAQVYVMHPWLGRVAVQRRYGELWFEELRLQLRPKQGWRGCCEFLFC